MGIKHCGKKEKLFVSSNFSFSHGVFKRLALQICKNKGLFGKGVKQALNHVIQDHIDDDDFVGFRSLRALGIYGMDH